jgi:regulator of PEP synthase PpsR (kinase-PPPase family)
VQARAKIFIISGGDGSSGNKLAKTATAQFPDTELDVIVIPGIRTHDDLRHAFETTVTPESIVIHTLVDRSLRDQLIDQTRNNDLVEFDALGPILDFITTKLKTDPIGKPGLYRKLREDYFRRIEAIEYAVQHDDGRRFDELKHADIVLAGVSRAGKTPLSMYLGMLGYKTANVPLVKDIDPPDELLEVDRNRVFGLSLDPDRLAIYRRRRQKNLGAGSITDYSDLAEVYRDLEYARQIFRRGRFTIIDVTNKPIEESASEITALLIKRF